MYLNGVSYELSPHGNYAKCNLEVICNRNEELLKLRTLYNKSFMVSEKVEPTFAFYALPTLDNVSPIKKVIFNDPATIVLWADGTKTIVKVQGDDVYNREQGLALCIAKKALGNKSNFNNEFKRWLNEEDTNTI